MLSFYLQKYQLERRNDGRFVTAKEAAVTATKEIPVYSDPGNPVFAFYENYSRMAIITHAFYPKRKEFWICLDSPNGVIGYFRFKTPPDMDFQRQVIKSSYLGHAELIGVFPASFSVPRSADVYRLFLRPQKGGS
jgi:hypothetical protein